MTHLEVIETWMQRVWKEKDTAAIHEMFVPDGLATGMGAPLAGPGDFEAFHQQFIKLIDDIDIKVTKHNVEGDWSFTFCTLECVNMKNREQKINITGTIFARIEKDKIIEAYNHFDFLTLYEELGLLPTNTFGKCLCGEGIREVSISN